MGNILILILSAIVAFVAGVISASILILPKVLKNVFGVLADEIERALSGSNPKKSFSEKLKERVNNG